MKSEPKASRPDMPEYGLQDAKGGRGLLPWSWARERLESARRYWVSTSRADGAPHSMPVWGVWVDDRFYFSTGRKSRKARNLMNNPRCVITTESAEEAVIVEGDAAELTHKPVFQRVGKLYKKKYEWALDRKLGPVFAVQPRRAFAFIDRPDEFTTTATRWVF